MAATSVGERKYKVDLSWRLEQVWVFQWIEGVVWPLLELPEAKSSGSKGVGVSRSVD